MINLEELKEKLRKRKEKKEFIREKLKKGEVTAKFKFTSPEDISKVKSTSKRMMERASPKTRQLTKKLYSKLYKKPSGSKIQLAMERERTKQMQMQMRQQRQIEAERVAMSQDPRFQQSGDDFADFVEQPQREFVEDDYGREQRGQGILGSMGRGFSRVGGGFGEAWRKWQASQKNKPRQAGNILSPQGSMMRPQGSILTPQNNLIQANPVNNMLTPMGSPLVREPANLAAPINNKVPARFKIW